MHNGMNILQRELLFYGKNDARLVRRNREEDIEGKNLRGFEEGA